MTNANFLEETGEGLFNRKSGVEKHQQSSRERD
jgi:hypothetical protein